MGMWRAVWDGTYRKRLKLIGPREHVKLDAQKCPKLGLPVGGAQRDSVQQATEADWPTRARDTTIHEFKYYYYIWRKQALKGTCYFRDLRAVWTIILRSMLQKYGVKLWPGFNWLKSLSSYMLSWTRNKRFDSIQEAYLLTGWTF
jgi:hypothetical protein